MRTLLSNIGLDDHRRIAHLGGVLMLLVIVALFLTAAFPTVVGADHSYVVQSDSMSPAIDAGAVVFVTEGPPERISENDVITFEQSGADRRVTHRVVDIVDRDGERHFRTKGDANEDPDPDLVAPSEVVGTVAFSVPLMGYVISFANSDVGLLTLVVVPAGLLVILEIYDLLYTDDAESEEES